LSLSLITPSLHVAGFEDENEAPREAAAIKVAIRGADAVQVICPVQAQAEDAAEAMGKTIDAIAGALTELRPAKVLAISDYVLR
jgi:NAD(P)H dehydrogenase (quinone)